MQTIQKETHFMHEFFNITSCCVIRRVGAIDRCGIPRIYLVGEVNGGEEMTEYHKKCKHDAECIETKIVTNLKIQEKSECLHGSRPSLNIAVNSQIFQSHT
jgi:hypothetical protein